jgi:hypothetical protein
MGFWPYLRHAQTSEDTASAATWHTTFFCWFFLRAMESQDVFTEGEMIAISVQELKRGMCTVPSLGSRHAAGALPPARLRPRRWGRSCLERHFRRCHHRLLLLLLWRRRRRRHGQQLRRKRQRQLRRRRWWGAEGLEQLVGVRTEPGAEVRKAPAGVDRLLVTGGAASLEVAPGVRLIDTPDFPEEWKTFAQGGIAFLDALRAVRDIDWTFFSPAAVIEETPRLGHFRTGTDQLVVDDKGDSKIGFSDYAIAMVDELENPQHSRSRFTAAY